MKTEYHRSLETYLGLEGFRLYNFQGIIELIKKEKLVCSWPKLEFTYSEAIIAANAEIAHPALTYN